MAVSVKPFDIITCKYPSLDSSIKVGMFVVLYLKDNNILCVKVTSQFDCRYLSHSVLLSQKQYPQLHTNSYVQLDKVMCVYSNTIHVIGSCNHDTMLSIKNVLNRFHYEILTELNKFIEDEYVSPNVKGKSNGK